MINDLCKARLQSHRSYKSQDQCKHEQHKYSCRNFGKFCTIQDIFFSIDEEDDADKQNDSQSSKYRCPRINSCEVNKIFYHIIVFDLYLRFVYIY